MPSCQERDPPKIPVLLFMKGDDAGLNFAQDRVFAGGSVLETPGAPQGSGLPVRCASKYRP